MCFSGELDWESTKKLYRELLLVFDRILLPTHASCHVQFIMFYICSFKDVSEFHLEDTHFLVYRFRTTGVCQSVSDRETEISLNFNGLNKLTL